MSTTTSARQQSSRKNNASLQENATEKLCSAKQEVRNDERFQSIQACAYRLWEQAGRPGGDEAREQFWYAAEEEISDSHATEA